MDHQRHAAAVTDEAVGDEIARDIARALAVDPSPEFLARVRMQIASEPAPGMWRSSFLARRSAGRAKAGALRSSWLAASVAVAVAIVLAIVVIRPDRSGTITGNPPLAARAIAGDISIPYVGSGFSRTSEPYGVSAFRRTAASPAKAGRRVLLLPLLDPRETQALRSLLAGIRNNRVDLSPLLTATAPAPTELPPAGDLVIAPIAIEPIAPTAGAQGERQ